MTRHVVLRAAIARLAAAGVPDPERDARVLLCWASGMDRAGFSAALAEKPAADEAIRFADAVSRRAERVPVSQIIGQRLFWGRDFATGPEVLDPRPESETLIALALDGAAPRRILDLGIGSGCLLVTLLAEWPEAAGLGIDCSGAALEIAHRNAASLGVADRCELRPGNWLDGVHGTYDLVVANPPYLAESEIVHLSPEVRDHEPRIALTPGGDGLDAYRAILSKLPQALTTRGRALFEIGPTQAVALRGLVETAGLVADPPVRDLDGRDRVVCVHR